MGASLQYNFRIHGFYHLNTVYRTDTNSERTVMAQHLFFSVFVILKLILVTNSIPKR